MISGLRDNFFPLATPDHTVPYGTVLSRGAVPGTSCQATIGVVRTGRAPSGLYDSPDLTVSKCPNCRALRAEAGSLCYFTPLPSRGGYAEALAGGFPYLASQSGEQSSIGFQPVSSVDYGWLAFLSGPPISDCLDEKIEVGWWFDTGWKPMLLYAVAMSRRVRGTACEEDFHTSRASPESKVA